MQYYKPEGACFVGDCMPFYEEGLFRLYYLLDEGHHSARGGLGGHQWAQASSPDLIHWTHHPLALAITEEYEGSICTGSVFLHQGVYYAFYATRMPDWQQHVGLATSLDGVHYEKIQPELAYPPEGYSPYHYRDPNVFQDPQSGIFHLLVTAEIENPAIGGHGGCLAHLTSADLVHWQQAEPFLIPGFGDVPECPDTFFWNGWYYLMFSSQGVAHYRMARSPLGAWTRPVVDTLDGSAARVMKTAAFRDGRRIGVAWVGEYADGADEGGLLFGGNAVFREIIQHADGTLGTKFVAEMLPIGKPLPTPEGKAITAGASCEDGKIRLTATSGLEAAMMSHLPGNYRLKAKITHTEGAGSFGLRLRAKEEAFDSGYDLRIAPAEKKVSLHGQSLSNVEPQEGGYSLEIVITDTLIDVCVNQQRTLIDRCALQKGHSLWWYAWDCGIHVEGIEIFQLD